MSDAPNPDQPAKPPPPADTNPPPAKQPPGIIAFLTQYAGPTVVASLIASGISIYTAYGAAQEKQREYNTKFEALVTSEVIRGAFGGSYVAPDAKTAKQDAAKEQFLQSVSEQRATAELLSLQSVAESETQRRTVLLIGARLLNASPSYIGTGAPASRLLTVLLDEIDSGRNSWNPWERQKNERLWETINAQSFRDLVTAGYSNDYYNDSFDNPALRQYWPTLNGDWPITTDARFQVLWKLTPEKYDGWIHLATFGYRFSRGKPVTAVRGSRTSSQVLTRKSALNFLDEVVDVTLHRDVENIGPLTQQYAIADPRATPPAHPLFVAADLVKQPGRYPKTLIMLRHRLIRNRPPVQYINPDGSFHKGSLGRILGAVPAGSCIELQEPLIPVLVFIPTEIAHPPAPAPAPQKPAKPAKPAKPSASSTTQSGLVHMWAHVTGSRSDENCLAALTPPR